MNEKYIVIKALKGQKKERKKRQKKAALALSKGIFIT